MELKSILPIAGILLAGLLIEPNGIEIGLVGQSTVIRSTSNLTQWN